jgi:hypothetical protein
MSFNGEPVISPLRQTAFSVICALRIVSGPGVHSRARRPIRDLPTALWICRNSELLGDGTAEIPREKSLRPYGAAQKVPVDSPSCAASK